jgi:hypothetical protein
MRATTIKPTHPHFVTCNKIKYIHHNPIKRGYVDEAISARDYEGIDGLIEVEKFW